MIFFLSCSFVCFFFLIGRQGLLARVNAKHRTHLECPCLKVTVSDKYEENDA